MTNMDNLSKPDQCRLFIIELLFKDYVPMPDKNVLTNVFKRHIGDVSCPTYTDEMSFIVLDKYKIKFAYGFVSPQILIRKCDFLNHNRFSPNIVEQMWDCAGDRNKILNQCKYSVIVSEFMGQGLNLYERVDMLMDTLESVLELYPQCEAVYMPTAGKLFTAQTIRNHSIPREFRFIYFGVNVRFFKDDKTDDFIVDSLGMGVLYFPDVQYRFKNINPDVIVMHAYNICAHILKTNNCINNADTVDGADENGMNPNMRWLCQYKRSIYEPYRTVIEISTNK